MFESMGGGFDEAYPQVAASEPAAPLRLRKTLNQRLVFWGANALVMPLVALCYLTVSAEGLRQTVGVMSMRLYKLPIPGAGLLREWDGWNRLDVSLVMALLMFVAVTYIWIRVFMVLLGGSSIPASRSSNPILFYLLATIIGIILLGDCAIFYFGLEAKASSGWGTTPSYLPAVATLLYMAGLALIGAWHADYHAPGVV